MSKLPDPLSPDIRIWFPQAEVHLVVGELIEALAKAGYTVFPTNRVEKLDLWAEMSNMQDEQLEPGFDEYKAQYLASAMASFAVDVVKDKTIMAVARVDEQRRCTRYVSKISIVVATKEELEAEKRERERARFEAAQLRNARREGGRW